MSTRVRTRTRLFLALAAMASMIFALMPASPAAAANGAVTVTGTAVLSAGISAPCTSNIHSGTFSGWANGVHASTPPGTVVAAPLVDARNVSASYLYCNSSTALGTAEGSITVGPGRGTAPSHTCGFSWIRVGATAVVTFDAGCGGAAVAGFAPTSVPGATPGTAEVVGAGVITH